MLNTRGAIKIVAAASGLWGHKPRHRSVEKNFGALVGNISLCFFLGFAGILGKNAGHSIRHPPHHYFSRQYRYRGLWFGIRKHSALFYAGSFWRSFMYWVFKLSCKFLTGLFSGRKIKRHSLCTVSPFLPHTRQLSMEASGGIYFCAEENSRACI